MNRNTILGTIGIGKIEMTFLQVYLFFQQNNGTSESTTKATKLSMSKLAEANNGFGFDFSQFEKQNIVISPSSIALALAMIRNGTEGETLAEVTTVLNLEQFKPQSVDTSYARLIEILENTDVDVLAIANSL